MKRHLLCLLISLAFAVPVLTVTPACQAPSARNVQVQSLKAVGQSAEATLALSAQLYRDGRITAEQARAVLDFYNVKYLPAFRVAVSAVQANLDSIASPDLIGLASQLANLVNSYAK